jgi:iron only hydrogenase large subunit-like protein
LNGIDITSVENEPADEPLSGRSSSAVLAEVSGGLAEGVLRLFYYSRMRKEADKQYFKKIRSSGSFREASVEVGDTEVKVAIVDGLTGLEKLKSALASGKKYSLVEVMTCPGGCVHGAGLSFHASKDEIRSRSRLVYQIDETEAINLPCKSPALLNLYDNLMKANPDVADKKIFYTHFEKRNVLL